MAGFLVNFSSAAVELETKAESSFSVSSTTTAVSFASVLLLLLLLRRDMHIYILVEVVLLLTFFLLLAAMLVLVLVLVLLTTSVLKQRRAPATVSSFYVSVLCTAMLRTSIAAVVLGCFYFCPLDCHASVMVVYCAAVETRCMLQKYIKVAHLLRALQQSVYIRTWYIYKTFFFIFRSMRYTDVCFVSLSGVLFPRE